MPESCQSWSAGAARVLLACEAPCATAVLPTPCTRDPPRSAFAGCAREGRVRGVWMTKVHGSQSCLVRLSIGMLGQDVLFGDSSKFEVTFQIHSETAHAK